MDQIKLKGIKKSYGKELAVHNLDLTVNSGDFLTILGPSGCGKTTLLRAIAGLEEPDSGEIQFGDRMVFSQIEGVIIPPEKRNVLSSSLLSHATAEVDAHVVFVGVCHQSFVDRRRLILVH